MQMEYIKSFDYNEIGNWPNEKYTFSPITENIEAISKPVYIYFPVYGNPSIDYGIYSKNSLIDYEYGSIYKDYDSYSNKHTLNLFKDVTPLSFYYAPNHRELYPYSVFNVFGIESDNIVKGFYINPKRLFFKPISIEKLEIGWRIKLSAVILGKDPVFFQSNNFINDALAVYKNDKESYESKQEYNLPFDLRLKYEVKGTEKFFNRKIINFTTAFNPSSYGVFLENPYTQIKKNSIYLTNKHYVLTTDDIISESSYYNNEDNDFFNFNGYRYNYNNDNDKQHFYIYNNPSDSNDSWLYASITPSDTYFEYYSNTEKITGVPDSYLGIRYISDSDKIKVTDENVLDTIITFKNNESIMDINQEFFSDDVNEITLDLKYPPHYYNFNLKYKAFSDFFNISSTLMFDGSSNDIIFQKIYDYFSDPFFTDDTYIKFSHENYPVDDSFYKSTGVLLSSLSSYTEYILNEIVEISAYSTDTIKNTILNVNEKYSEISYNIDVAYDTPFYKTKGVTLSGILILSDYKYLSSSSFDGLTSIIFDLGFDYSDSSFYKYNGNTISLNNKIYVTSGIYNTSTDYYNDTFVQQISTYDSKSYFVNNVKTITATNTPELTGIIYNLGEPYSNYAEITSSVYHDNEYISTGITLSGVWVCIDQQIATGTNYSELTASANSFGGIYSTYAKTTSEILFLNEFKSTGAYLNGLTYNNVLSSFAFQMASPQTYYNVISTFDTNVNFLYNISISSYNENFTSDIVLYNSISVYKIDNRLYDNYVEGYSLNYDITSKIVDFDTEYVKISTYLFSEYHLSILDLETYGGLDLIKYEFLNLSNELKPYLSCYYSEEKIPYNIYDLDWINATSGCLLYIEYPNSTFGEVAFEIIPKLSTYSGFLESFYKTKIVLSENITNDSNIYDKIFLKNKNETSNNIEIELISIADDLENTNISWKIEPQSDNVVLYIKDPVNNDITYINQDENLVYVKDYTSTVFVSGYVDNQIKIIGYSEKYNQYPELIIDYTLFDLLKEGIFTVAPLYELDNQKQIRNIDIASYISESNVLLDLPNDFSIYWIWEYGDITDSQYQPITALKLDGTIYSCGETDTIQNLSSLSFFIRPNINYAPIENIVKVKAFAFNEKNNFIGEYIFTVDDYPHIDLYNLNIETYYDLYPLDIIHSTKNTPILTRPLNNFSVYTFKIDKSETSIFKFLDSYDNIKWEFFDDLGFYQSITGIDQVDHYEIYNSLNWELNYIKVTIENIYIPTWNKPHTFTKVLYINSLPESSFYKPLNLLIYPEYYWTPETPYINFTDNENFIYSIHPLTYENKKSETYNFYVSADKEATQYEYSTGDILFTQEGLLKIPESTELKSIYGMTISVSAFDSIYFPKENGIFYKIVTEEGLIDLYMENLTFTSIPFNAEVGFQMENFKKSPKIIPFDTFNFTFSSVFSSIDIKNNRIIVIDQFILPDYKQSPVKIIEELSTITYTLSTKYWTFSKIIEAKTGKYNVFELNIGNSLDLLTISDKKIDTLYIYAEANIKKTIPAETFKNYPSYENKELWKTVDELIDAKILDDAFISSI